jgi:hypothetical protein
VAHHALAELAEAKNENRITRNVSHSLPAHSAFKF